MGTITRTVAERGGQVGLSIQCSRLWMKAVAARVCLGFHKGFEFVCRVRDLGLGVLGFRKGLGSSGFSVLGKKVLGIWVIRQLRFLGF